MKRRLGIGALLLVAAVAVYWSAFRDDAVTPTVSAPRPVALLGEGDDAVVVTARGALVPWFPAPEDPTPEDPTLPRLPEVGPPKGGRLRGPMLEQARVLGAVPAALQPYVERSYYGETGVDVVLTTGIELRFGDASQAPRKWKAAAVVLADPTTTALDYVNVQAPAFPSAGGEGHILPPVP